MRDDGLGRRVMSRPWCGFRCGDSLGPDRVAASRAGNDPVTGSVSAKIRPPPGRPAPAASPPSSAACSAAIARPRPELPPGARGVRLVEAVEQVRAGPRRGTPGPRSATTITAPSPRRRQRDLDRRVGRVVAGVVEEVAEDPVEATRVGLHDHGVGGQRDRRLPGGAPRRSPVTSRPRSTGSRTGRSASASNREISISSSTRSAAGEHRRPGARRRAARRAASRRVRRSISDASATSAVSGVRSSCDTSATNLRFCCCADSSRPTVRSSESAIRLNSAAQRAELVAAAARGRGRSGRRRRSGARRRAGVHRAAGCRGR